MALGFYAVFYLVFVGIRLAGVGEALKVMMVISGLAVLAIIATAVVLVANFDSSNLYDVAAVTDAAGASEFLPLGWYGVWAALPFAMWLFLAVEGVPLAAEEAKNPAKDVPKGIIGAMIFLLFTALLVVVLVPGVGGAATMGASAVPLVRCIKSDWQ
ncbi:amino acid permease [Paucibacter sp. O1-1]|nr:amino acid permease [Paucibacter sp. O1-1]MDA3824426.1 amino acid permease [Paucibacter sp. O1-1]